jgi:hypothetical protein
MAFKLAQSFQNRTLAVFHGRLDQQQLLLRRIRAELPQSLAIHVLYCVVNEKKLLLYTDSAAWASQLRFLKQNVLQAACDAQGHPFEKLQIRILADQTGKSPQTERKANLPSAEKIAMIRNQANAIGDSQLQQALQRLSATLVKLTDG